MSTAEALIAALELEPLGFEGGMYRETYRGAAGPDGRAVSTAIYYLLRSGEFSRMHRLQSDEMYHFYRGDPTELLMLFEDGHHELYTLGPDVEAGQRLQLLVPAGVWQGCRLKEGGAHALFGVTVAPGFELREFESGAREALCEAYPEAEELICALTASHLRTVDLDLLPATAALFHADATDRAFLAKGLDTSVPAAWPPEGHDPLALAAEGAECWYIIHRAGRRLIGVYTRRASQADLRWLGVGGDREGLRRQVEAALDG